MPVTTTYNQVITTSILSVNRKDWSSVAQNKNIYLSLNYLEALEKTMGEEIDFFYSIVYNEEKEPVLISVFQLVTFVDKRKKHSQAILRHFAGDKKEKRFSMNILVCGNVFSDGENGFLWNDKITSSKAIEQVTEIAARIKKDKATKKKLSVVLFKDFPPESTDCSDKLKEYNYKDFMVDVNMVLPIHASWKSMDDYLLSMKTKFRTRAKGVFKKSNSLDIKSLSALEIEKYTTDIDTLFKNVLEKSEYSFGTIKPASFISFKEALGDSFSFRGVFLEDKLVGFSTAFFHKGIMEANYVGIDYEHNVELAIYQKLLYDYVNQAIENNASELQLGRTSELIKSALGAEPVDMKLYAKHKAVISNLLMSSILCFVSPSKFELRKPFKANFNN